MNRAEGRHHLVADELVQRAAMLKYLAGGAAMKLAEEGKGFFRRVGLGKVREVEDIGEQDGGAGRPVVRADPR